MKDFITKKTLGLLQGRMNTKTMKRAQRRAKGLVVKHENRDIRNAMLKAGIKQMHVYYIIDEGIVKVWTVPGIEIDEEVLKADSEYLIQMGFKAICLKMNTKNYRIIDLEFQTEKVEKYLKDKANLFNGLQMAQNMEGKIK